MANDEKRWQSSHRPFSDWARWEEEMSKKFEDFLERGRKWWPSGFASTSSGPPVDVYDENDEIVVRAELPGMQKEDVDIYLAGLTLTIKGEKKRAQQVDEKDYYRREIAYGPFTRIIDLPHEVQPGKGRASFEKGILEVRFPNTASAKTKSTKIDIA
jgi:HSP20 family protein